VFTPDGSDNNRFLVFSDPAVERVTRLSVYSRWGEHLFDARDIAPNDPSVGWDGSFRGVPMQPGVYVWVAHVRFIDGVLEQYSGDVTIVR
jgi:hypothetical protein